MTETVSGQSATVYATGWDGVSGIASQPGSGNDYLAQGCTSSQCHTGSTHFPYVPEAGTAPDMFPSWAGTKHAVAFSDGIDGRFGPGLRTRRACSATRSVLAVAGGQRRLRGPGGARRWTCPRRSTPATTPPSWRRSRSRAARQRAVRELPRPARTSTSWASTTGRASPSARACAPSATRRRSSGSEPARRTSRSPSTRARGSAELRPLPQRAGLRHVHAGAARVRRGGIRQLPAHEGRQAARRRRVERRGRRDLAQLGLTRRRCSRRPARPATIRTTRRQPCQLRIYDSAARG